jgi:hypothetical protein
MPIRILEQAEPEATGARRVRVLEPAPEAMAEQAQAEPDVSQLQGFAKGTNRVVENVLPAMSAMYPSLRSLNPQARAMKAVIGQREAQGIQSGEGGELAGSIAASLPFAFLGGPMGSGAMQGYAASEADDLQGKIVDAGIGAVGGKLAGVAVDAIAGGVRGVADPVMRRLADSGVRLPPGVALGRTMKTLEDKATSLPIVGGMIERGRAQAMDDWRAGAINEVLKPLGIQVPKGVTGHEAVAFAQDAISTSYDDLLPRLSAKVDRRFAVGLRKAFDEVKVAPIETQKKLALIIEDAMKTAPDGTLAGEALRRAEMKFGQHIADLGRSSNPDDQAMRRGVQAVLGDLRDLMVRANPDAAAELKATHQAFKAQLAVDSAASKATDGAFSPSQLSTGARTADRSVRKRASARGEGGPMQAWADMGKRLQSMVPDSGTASRMALLNPMGLAVGLPAAIGYDVTKRVAKALGGPRSADAAVKAAKIKKLARPAAGLGSTAVSNRPRD